MGKLTATKAKSITKPGRYGDGNTLYLNVAPGGSKSWVQRLTIDARRHDIGLGPYPVVPLAMARRRAAENRTAVADGHDPLAEKRRALIPTFHQAARQTYEALKPSWRNGKHTKNWIQAMEKRVFPVIGNMPVDKVGREDVLRILTPIWAAQPETARKLRQRIRATLRWCLAHGFIEQNVAGEAIDGALPAMPAVKAHFRALPYQEVPRALEIVETSKASMVVKLCFRFLVLTATRSGEARGAAWSEIDMNAATWSIPGERMKGGIGHRVPLCGVALDVLEQAKTLRDGLDLIFPSPARRGKPLSDMTLTKVLRDNNLADRATVHGFRSSFRTWASERTNSDHAVMELCLAHAVGSAVEQAYARSDLLAKRRILMEQWGAFVAGSEEGKVVQLHG